MAEAFDGIRSDYAAARSSRHRRRRTGVNPTGSGADYHYRSEGDYLRLLEQARDFDRNDVLVGQMVDRVLDNTIQDGFRLDVDTGDDGLDDALETRWREWSRDADQCDVAGECSFAEIERLVLRHTIVDGDVLVLPLKDGSLQVVEGHRLRTPSATKQNVVLGVKLDQNRRRLEYWITRDDIDPNATLKLVSDTLQIKARGEDGHRQVFHILNPKRASQTRGVTAFAPIFDHCGMFEDINFARLVQQQVVSCFAILREREGDFAGGKPAPTGAQTTETQADGSARVIQGIAPGMEIPGLPGEKISAFSPNVPNPEYFDHVRLIMQLIGINLGLPLVLLLLDASETNFSGFRGAVDQARLGFRRNQESLIRRLHCPTYQWKVRQWMAEDPAIRSAEAAGKNVFGHHWHPPTWPYIEPLKDGQAAVLRIQKMLTSPRREHAKDGRDFYEIVTETVADNAYKIRAAKTAAMEINKEFKDDQPCHWRELLSDGPDPTEPGGKEEQKPASGKPQKETADVA